MFANFSSSSLRNLAFIALSCSALLSCAYSSKKSSKILEQNIDSSFDMVIVPGVPLINGQWDSVMKARIYWSKYLFDKGIAQNIMYSGSAVYTAYYEAEVMKLYAIEIGIPENNIYTETKAEHSTENLYYGYHKSKKLGFKNIALASDPFQSKQLKSYAKKRFPEPVIIIPFVTDILRSMHPIMTNPVIDYQKAEKQNFVSITERESLWKRLKGTMSWNIDKSAYQ